MWIVAWLPLGTLVVTVQPHTAGSEHCSSCFQSPGLLEDKASLCRHLALYERKGKGVLARRSLTAKWLATCEQQEGAV